MEKVAFRAVVLEVVGDRHVPVDPGYAVSGAQPDVARTVLPDAGDVVAGKSVRHAQRAVFRTFYIHDPFVVAAEPDSLLGVFENIEQWRRGEVSGDGIFTGETDMVCESMV